jgi:hypothetical protein
VARQFALIEYLRQVSVPPRNYKSFGVKIAVIGPGVSAKRRIDECLARGGCAIVPIKYDNQNSHVSLVIGSANYRSQYLTFDSWWRARGWLNTDAITWSANGFSSSHADQPDVAEWANTMVSSKRLFSKRNQPYSIDSDYVLLIEKDE